MAAKEPKKYTDCGKPYMRVFKGLVPPGTRPGVIRSPGIKPTVPLRSNCSQAQFSLLRSESRPIAAQDLGHDVVLLTVAGAGAQIGDGGRHVIIRWGDRVGARLLTGAHQGENQP